MGGKRGAVCHEARQKPALSGRAGQLFNAAVRISMSEPLMIHVTPLGLDLAQAGVQHWHLDGPVAGAIGAEQSTVLIRGWAVPIGDGSDPLHFVIKTSRETLCYPMNEDRQDLVEHFSNAAPPLAVPVRSGFRYEASLAELRGGVFFGFETRGRIVLARRVVLVEGGR
jgi:hypothetical protein